jgi:hypothetical protein
MYLDYYTFDLLPGVWHRDGTIVRVFRHFLQEQLRRFPQHAVVETLLVGDAAQHYWTDNSPIDLLLRVTPEHQQEVVKLAEQMVGKIDWQDHPVEFFPVPAASTPDQLAERFGPVYALGRCVWHGVVPYDTEELLRPSGLVRRFCWLQYRVLRCQDLDPYDWQIEKTAFGEQTSAARYRTLALLRQRVAVQQRKVVAVLRKLDRETWKAATIFEKELEENAVLQQNTRLPLALQRHLVSLYRWRWLMEDLEELDSKRNRLEQMSKTNPQPR